MFIVILLAFILIAAFGIIWRMFSSLKQEALRAEELSAVPVSDAGVLMEEAQAKVEVPTPVKTTDRGLDDIPWRTPSLLQEKPLIEPLKKVVVAAQDESALVNVLTEDQKTLYENQIFQLKEEVKLIREKAVDQARNALEVINKMRESNDRISAENEQLKGNKPLFNADEVSHLKAENAALKNEISRDDEERLKSFQEKEALRFDFDRKMQQANESVLAAENDYKKKLAVLVEDNSSLRRVNDELKAATDGVLREKDNTGEARSRIALLEADNARLKEKNEFFQYELTKVKAQSMGLQRVCDNLRKRTDEQRPQSFEWQADGEQIRKRVVLLEQSIQEFRSLNDVLLKKENLTQYEMEKNREQVGSLENIYTDLCHRLSRVVITEEDLTATR